MKIRDVMTSNPRTVSPDDTIQAAARIMQTEDTAPFLSSTMAACSQW